MSKRVIDELVDWLRSEKYALDCEPDKMTQEYELEHEWEISRNNFIDKTLDKILELVQQEPCDDNPMGQPFTKTNFSAMAQCPLVPNTPNQPIVIHMGEYGDIHTTKEDVLKELGRELNKQIGLYPSRRKITSGK